MYYLLFGFLYLISLLPFFVLYAISDFTAFLMYNVFGYRKGTVMHNLDIAFPEKSPEEKQLIAKKFYHNLTDTFVESVKLISLSERRLRKRATVDFEVCRQLEQEGKSIQMHSGHQMNWEYANHAFSMNMSIPFIGIYMRIKNKPLNRLFIYLRSKYGAKLIAAQDFRNTAHTFFDQQYALGLVADQNPGVPSSAYWLNFFSRPAPFVTGPDKGARRNNAAVVFVKFIKKRRGYYHFESILVTKDGSTFKDGELTLKYRDFLEETIREQPDNYLWSHRRWKWGWDDSYQKRWIDSRERS